VCGLFGWIGTSCDADVLSLAANYASRRGPDVCGVLSDSAFWSGRPDKIPPLSPQRLLMGHYRLATSLLGALECQPLRRNGYSLAHNGSIENYDLAVRQFRPKLATNIDSELLLWAIEQAVGDLIERLKQALEVMEMGDGWALSVSDGRALLLASSNLDLYVFERSDAWYWCSVQIDECWQPVAGMKKRELAPYGVRASIPVDPCGRHAELGYDTRWNFQHCQRD
jgi:hypothetical protein